MRVLSWVTMTLPWVMDLAPGCDRVGAWVAGLSLAMVGRAAAAPSRAWRRSTGALRDMASPVWVEYVGNGFSVVIKSPGVLDVIDAPCKQPDIHRNSRRNQPEIARRAFGDGVAGWLVDSLLAARPPLGWRPHALQLRVLGTMLPGLTPSRCLKRLFRWL